MVSLAPPARAGVRQSRRTGLQNIIHITKLPFDCAPRKTLAAPLRAERGIFFVLTHSPSSRKIPKRKLYIISMLSLRGAFSLAPPAALSPSKASGRAGVFLRQSNLRSNEGLLTALAYGASVAKRPLAGTQKVNMAKYRIFYWKHIPSSITVEGDGKTIKKQLSQKIQNAIDAYAMAEGLTGTSEYAAQYKRGAWTERDGTPEEIADALLSELETEFAKIEIPRLVRS